MCRTISKLIIHGTKVVNSIFVFFLDRLEISSPGPKRSHSLSNSLSSLCTVFVKTFWVQFSMFRCCDRRGNG